MGFRVDRDAIGVARARQHRRVRAARYERDLGGGEGDYLMVRAVAVGDVEVVEVAAGGPHDQHAPGHGFTPPPDLTSQPGTGWPRKRRRLEIFLSRGPGP